MTSDTNGPGTHGDGGLDLRTAVSLLPTPAVNDMGAAYTPETWDAWTATMKAKHNNGNGHGKSLNVEAQRMRVWVDAEDPDAPPGDGYWTTVDRLLPTPRATDGTKGGPNQRGSSGDLMLPSAVSSLLPTPSVADSTGGHERRGGARGEELLLKGVVRAQAEGQLLPTPMAGDAKMARNSTADRKSEPPTGIHAGDTLGDISHADRWGEYGSAIRRWEAITRPAPEPTKLGAKGNPKLSDEFDEWLMGLPAGWITDVPGVTWNEALKACGNGVVPPQAAAAIWWLLSLDDLGVAAA